MPARSADGRFTSTARISHEDYVAKYLGNDLPKATINYLHTTEAKAPQKKFGLKVDTPYRRISTRYNFPHCCGFGIFYGFSNVDPNKFDRELKECIKSGKDSAWGGALIALNNNQVNTKCGGKTWHDVLLENGFNLVCQHTNPVHDNRSVVSLYIINTGRKGNVASLDITSNNLNDKATE